MSKLMRVNFQNGKTTKDDIFHLNGSLAESAGRLVTDNRSAANLIPIIRDAILPGSTIFSDEWSSYSTVRNLPGFRHLTVNHSLHFVDPITGAHTQNIECHWKNAKRRNKKHHGTHRQMVESYLCEWMWRQRHKDVPDKFLLMLEHIGRYFLPS